MRSYLPSYSQGEDTDKERQTLLALLGADQDPMPATVELPEQNITLEDRPHARMSADDFPVTGDQPANDNADPAPELEHAHISAPASSGDGFDWGMLGALVLDAGMNKGRGVGQLIGAYANNREAAARAKEQHKLRLEEIAARKGDTDMADWKAVDASQRDYEGMRLREEAIAATKEGLGIRGKAENRLEDKFGQQQDPDSPLLGAGVEVARRKAEAGVKGREEEKAKLAETIADNVANVATARTKATTEAKNETPPDPTPQQKIANKAKEDTRSEAELKAFNAEVGHYPEVLAAARKLQDIFKTAELKGKKHSLLAGGGTDYPGIGMLDSNKLAGGRSMEDERANAQLNILRSFIQQPVTGAAVGGQEESSRIGELAGKTKGWGATEQSSRVAIDELAKLAEARIRQAGSRRAGIARQAMKPHGLDNLFPDEAPPPQAEGDGFVVTPGVSKGRAVDYAPDAPGELGPPTAIKVDGATDIAKDQKRPRKMVTNTGKPVTAYRSDAEIQKLLAMGWSLAE